MKPPTLSSTDLADLHSWCGVIMLRVTQAGHTQASIVALSGLPLEVWDNISEYGSDGSCGPCPAWDSIVKAGACVQLQLRHTPRGVTGQHAKQPQN